MNFFFQSAALSAMLLLANCTTTVSTEQTTEVKADSSETTTKVETAKTSTELLQGKWQHTEDKSNFLVFEKERRKEIADGLDKWDDEPFVLSDKCMNTRDANNGIEKEKDRYISIAESDLCWYIVEVTETMLSLSYMGRGNTLNYTRVK